MFITSRNIGKCLKERYKHIVVWTANSDSMLEVTTINWTQILSMENSINKHYKQLEVHFNNIYSDIQHSR